MVFRFPGKRTRARGIDSNTPARRGKLLNPQLAAYRRLNPRLFTLAGLLACLLVVLAGGLAWQQILRRLYVPYHNGLLQKQLANDEIALKQKYNYPGKDDLEWGNYVKEQTTLEGDYLKKTLADYNEIESAQMLRCVLQPGPRGRILDRNGKVLVDNAASYSVVLYVDELRGEINTEFNRLRLAKLAQLKDDTTEVRPTFNRDELFKDARFNVALRYLAQANALLGRNETLDRKVFDRDVDENPLLPFTLIDNLSAAEYARFNAQMPVSSHMQTKVEALRFYPNPVAFHTLGYVKRTDALANDAQLGSSNFADLWRQYLRIQPEDKLPQHITFALPGLEGGTGLELHYNQELLGEAGGEIWVVDPSAAKCELVAHSPPKKGADLQCSLDLNLQYAAEKAFSPPYSEEPRIGSAVALDVRTGEVLAMAVNPSFDLNETVPSISQEFYDKLVPPDNPHSTNALNRATMAQYPAGSTFKLIDTIAGLRAGVLDGNFHLDCDASVTYNSHVFNEDTRTAQGNIDVATALEVSSDVFFFRVGVEKLHEDLITAEARRLGLGQPTGIGLGQANGLVPDPVWKKAHRNDPGDNYGKWTDDDTANLAVGQGYLLVTPLQMACMVASIARNETRTQPTLIHNPNLDPNAVQHGGEPLGLTPEQRQVLLTGMEKVVTGEHGTARLWVPIPGLRIAGKTGTAQWGPGPNTTVAWFVCFAPIDDPRIAVAVAVESPIRGADLYGGKVAGPIAHHILDVYFKEHPEQKR